MCSIKQLNKNASKMKSLNQKLAYRESRSASFTDFCRDLVKKMKTGSAWKGRRTTSVALGDYVLEPGDNAFTKVAYSMEETKNYITKMWSDYLQNLLDIDRTNSMSGITAPLEVDGEEWGHFTSLELLQLRGFLLNGNVVEVLKQLPTRPSNLVWEITSDPDLPEGTYENVLFNAPEKTTEKTERILEDPNAKHLKEGVQYTPKVTVDTKIVPTKSKKVTDYSSGMSETEHAEIQQRRTQLLSAVTVALAKINEQEALESNLSAERVVRYLLG